MSLLIVSSGLLIVLIRSSPISRLNIDPFGKVYASDENLGICNGEDASWSDYPQMVSIRNSADGHCCAATILDLQEGLLLTAAHCSACITNWSNGIVKIGCENPNTCTQGIPYLTAIFTRMPQYGQGSTYNYDVGTIRLQTGGSLGAPILNPPNAIEVNLDNNFPVNNQALVVVGYGRVAGQTSLPNQLQRGDVNVWTQANCAEALPAGAVITPQMVCARGVNEDNGYGITTCSGDSGGPWFSGPNLQVGITSWGYNGCSEPLSNCHCCVNYPRMAANIADPSLTIYNWIEVQMNGVRSRSNSTVKTL